MADIFKRREISEEAKFKLDAERQFKAEARRNKLLGLWAARRMGLSKAEADAFAKEVVASDFEQAGTGDVVRKIRKSFEKHGVSIDKAKIKRKLLELEAVALEQIGNEYPKALDSDHKPVGG